MSSDDYDMIRKFWVDRFGFVPDGPREEKIFLELAWVSYQNRKVMREIERAAKQRRHP